MNALEVVAVTREFWKKMQKYLQFS